MTAAEAMAEAHAYAAAHLRDGIDNDGPLSELIYWDYRDQAPNVTGKILKALATIADRHDAAAAKSL